MSKPVKEENKGVLKYDHTGATFPFVALITAKLVPGYKVIVRKGLEKPELTIVPSSDVLTGSYLCAKFIARSSTNQQLYGGSDALSASRVDEWLEKIAHLKTEEVTAFANQVNDHFIFRTFLVGFNITIADIALFARIQLVKELKDDIVNRAKNLPHLTRWLNYLNGLAAFKETVDIYTGEDKKKKEVKKEGEDDKAPKKGLMGWMGNMDRLALPGLEEGKVVTRFPPEPSGYLHIGHCKAAVLNNYYASEYKGELVLRFDDTNPAKEKDEYVENILKDLKTLGINYVRQTNTSDYFDLIEEKAIQLIKEGNGYVDNTAVDVIRDQREKMIESECRNNSIEKNLEWFDEMRKGTAFGQTCVLRAKIDMASVDRAFRDPAMYRVSMTPHHKTGDKYRAYPLYDFACPIVDSIEGITHALRSNEYQNKVNLYYYVCDILKLRRPYVSQYSRLNFTYVLLSKRKLQHFADTGIVSGWNDPRMPTLQGIMRRGLTVDALKEFTLSQGASSVNTTMDIGKLWAINKMFIEPFVPRYTCIPKKNVLVRLSNREDTVQKLVKPKFDKKLDLGDKTVTVSNNIFIEYDDAADWKEGEEITLMSWGMNVICRKINKNADGVVESIDAECNPTGSFKDTKKKLTWLSKDAKQVPVTLQDYDFLITKAKLEEEDKLDDYINPVTKFELDAFSDENILSLKVGDKVQFERRGLYICDKIGDENTPFVMIYIPDGSTKFKAGEALHPFVQREKKEDPKAKPAAKKSAAK
ncbi:glutamate-tRNA ligase [Heterostelium album PN500]|uniref:glutamate--tRNA ligase n=1 Tax=Heterostelium pallidum (strain ATCC 26659 / Pp 5 / PN500) TaxID=670386 RepID=D3B9H8_HETP5|nr:glutamate-tRNA ligase [Heterostelium album PN500]EFA81890.1 glutamate-tRNA ligase [Heterostelium album PN500]|eukprot:XP_020434007.1 glutamate-tRNA ligase [Heterostelium album PN500]